jgi:hypothetical protein
MLISSYFRNRNCLDAHFVWGADPEVVRQQRCEGIGCSHCIITIDKAPK